MLQGQYAAGNQLGAATPAVAPRDPYQEHQLAVQEYHESCHAYSNAAQRREKAASVLGQTTEALASLMQRAQCDPTVPQDASCTSPTNGLKQSYR